jgi:uncharacterized membrane protein YidH (DUF202 family)
MDCNNVTLASASIKEIASFLTCVISESIMPLLVALAVLGFVWGVIQYFLNPENEKEREKGKTFMLWGLIALFMIVSFWGVVSLLGNTFGVKTVIPQLSQ